MQSGRLHRYTYADCVALEESSSTKHEYLAGGIEQHPPSPRATPLNPTLLLEVTSDSSEEYDTTTKLESYQTIPSLRDYLVVSHRERRLTLLSRADDGTWVSRVAIRRQSCVFESIGRLVRRSGLSRWLNRLSPRSARGLGVCSRVRALAAIICIYRSAPLSETCIRRSSIPRLQGA